MPARDSASHELVRALSSFGAEVTPRLVSHKGEPEEQLRGPLDAFLKATGRVLGLKVHPIGETHLPELRSRPDYALQVNGSVAGYLEVKAPGKGVDPERFRGRDREQWERLRVLPNLAYTDGNSWALYHFGEKSARSPVVCEGDVRFSGSGLSADITALRDLLSEFLLWEPHPPRNGHQLAKFIAGLCRLLRDEVKLTLTLERQAAPGTARPFTGLANEWRELLFPDATDERFADSYAQTVTFALLLARAEGVDLRSRELSAVGEALEHHHGLLGRALQVLTNRELRAHVETSLLALIHVIRGVTWPLPEWSSNDWRYFYEGFLDVYDPKLRQEAGAYYTPTEVVETQVRLVDSLLKDRLDRPYGLASDGVFILDPAMGTGSYLIHVIQQAAETIKEIGPGLVKPLLEEMASRLIGFEIMASPFAVAEVFLTGAFRHYDASPALRLYLADTLSDPYVEQLQLGGMYEPIARSRREADLVKRDTPVLVCLGNPPYDRHRGDSDAGGWVRAGNPSIGRRPVFDDFRSNDRSINLYAVNLYNLYVYFWRWALWKVFEAHPGEAQGVVSFITASSFLRGPGFAEMRAHMRRVADEIWIVDASPEGLRPPKDTRIFPGVQVPICITILLRYGDPNPDHPARVRITTLKGAQRDKFRSLKRLELHGQDWLPCQTGWHDPFAPVSDLDWTALPALLDLMPWQIPGVSTERTWVIAPQQQILRERWYALLAAPTEERNKLLKANRNRTVHSTPRPLPGYGDARRRMTPLAKLPQGHPAPQIVRYSARSLDRQWILADHRLMYPARPALWAARGPGQVFLTTQHVHELRGGPALVASTHIPDRHHFNGRGGVVLPLWRRPDRREPNVLPGLTTYLSAVLGTPVTPEALTAYIAAVLAHNGYTRRFKEQLRVPGPRVPLTRDAALFDLGKDLGARVLWLQTYASAYVDTTAGRPQRVSRRRAEPEEPITGPIRSFSYDSNRQTLRVGNGTIAQVPLDVAHYEVSGMRVVSKWLQYRLAKPRRRKSSGLNEINPAVWPVEWTHELLDLLWTVEALLQLEPEQDLLLARVMEGPQITNSDLAAAGLLPVRPAAQAPPWPPTSDRGDDQLDLNRR